MTFKELEKFHEKQLEVYDFLIKTVKSDREIFPYDPEENCSVVDWGFLLNCKIWVEILTPYGVIEVHIPKENFDV